MNWRDIDVSLTNILGMYHIHEEAVIAPNTLVLLKSNEGSDYLAFQKLVDVLMDVMGKGEPLLVKNPGDVAYYYEKTLKIKDAVIVGERNEDNEYAIIIYIPKMSYGILLYPRGKMNTYANKLLTIVLFEVVNSGYSIERLLKEKAFTFMVDGKIITLPELKGREPITEGGIPYDALRMISRQMGRIMKYITRAIRFREVSSPGSIKRVEIEVTLPIKKVVVALDGEKIFNLDSPIMLSGTIKVTRDGEVIADGNLKLHPNISYDSGSICLGTIPPFDGTLSWLGRLLNTLSIARIDACSDSYGGTFIREFGYQLPPEVLDIWENNCGYDDYDEEEDYDDEGEWDAEEE